jgi:hypothetical protein
MKPLLAITFAFLAGLAQADVYKCTAGGKTIYSDVPCPAAKKIDTSKNANIYTGDPIPTLRTPAATSNASKCSDLADEMRRAAPDPSTQSFGEVRAAKKNYAMLRSQYEAQCMSSEQSTAASQERMERQMNRIERQQRQLHLRQQEIQNRQRGYGY